MALLEVDAFLEISLINGERHTCDHILETEDHSGFTLYHESLDPDDPGEAIGYVPKEVIKSIFIIQTRE